jgi:hypothetical protein
MEDWLAYPLSRAGGCTFVVGGDFDIFVDEEQTICGEEDKLFALF